MAGIHLWGELAGLSHADVYGQTLAEFASQEGTGKVEDSTAGYIGGLKDYYGVTVGIVARAAATSSRTSNVHTLGGPVLKAAVTLLTAAP